jgi:hypothetical protein
MPFPEDQFWGRGDSDLRDGLAECVFRSTESGRYRWISVGTVAVARTVLDYSLCWKAYYPE